MTELDAENLTIETTQDGQIVVEPSYIGFLRSQGFTIESIESAHTVHSDSRDAAHMVVEVVTYEYPRNHPELDYAQHETTVRACSCWSYRNNSGDVREGEKPGGTCKHVRSVFREERAKADDNQDTIV